MKSRILILFLTLLLFLAVFAAGTAAADTINDHFDDEYKHLLDYNAMIYVNGDIVTIVNNFENTGYPVRKINNIKIDNNAGHSIFKNFKVIEPNIIQFNLSDLLETDGFELNDNGEFTVYLCGALGESTSDLKIHVDQEITFKVEEVTLQSEMSDDENEISEEESADIVKTLIYPVNSGFINSFGTGDAGNFYYITSYGSVFQDESVYPNFKQELIDKNVIYSFDQGNLRFIYWYESDSEEVGFKSADSTLNAYVPEFTLNLSDLQDFNLNSIFLCPDHDTYHIDSSTFNGILCSDCASEFEWAVTIGDSEKDASNYLMTYDDLYPIEEEEDLDEDFDPAGDERDPEEEEKVDIISYPHFISFNSSALNGDLSKTRTQEIQFYPVLKAERDVGQQPAEPDESDPSLPGEEGEEDDESFISFKDKTYTFKFSRLYKSVPIELMGDTLQLVSETTDYSKPLVSSLSFPETVQNALKDNAIILESLNSHALDDVEDESGYLTPETSVLSVTDISFENSINEVLKENNETVEVSFVIPTVINGVEINPNDIAVLHISDDGESKSLDKLETTVSPKNINGVKYYAVTAKTSGFSPFAVISAETQPETVSKAGGQSFGEAVIVPSEEPVPADDKNGYENNLTPVTVIEDIITKIQGHLSVFSVLVVLTSGLFMWDYIRRRI